MQSKRKQNAVVGHTVDDSGKIEFKSEAGSFIVDMMVLSADVDFKMLPPLIQRAAIHGVIQKVSDRAAIGRDPETGASATPEEKFAAMKECAERLMWGGPWNAVATGGTGNQGGLLYRAMKAIYPNAWSDKTSFATYIMQKALSESERLKRKVSETDVRAGLMAVKRVAKEIDRIRQEEGKTVDIDAGGMLQELEGKA